MGVSALNAHANSLIHVKHTLKNSCGHGMTRRVKNPTGSSSDFSGKRGAQAYSPSNYALVRIGQT